MGDESRRHDRLEIVLVDFASEIGNREMTQTLVAHRRHRSLGYTTLGRMGHPRPRGEASEEGTPTDHDIIPSAIATDPRSAMRIGNLGMVEKL